MNILLVGSFDYPMYAPAFESGFRALGHNVVTVRYDDYLYGSGAISGFLSKFQTRFHVGLNLIRYNSDIIKRAKEFRVDFIFFYRCYNVWPSTVKKLKEKGFFVFTYNNDDPFVTIPSVRYYRNFKAILPLADLNYVYRKKNIDDYESVGAYNNKILLPYYIAKNNYRKECDKDIPIGFIAHFENDGRDQYIKALVDAGLPITVFNGSNWESAPLYQDIKNVIQPGKRGTEYNDTINRCQICLVLFSKLNSDTYTRRCFEIPATATLMLSEYTADMNSMFPENECAVYFRNKEELVEKCSYLLSNPSEISRIAENAYKRVMELGGSEIDRCRQIVDLYIQENEKKTIGI